MAPKHKRLLTWILSKDCFFCVRQSEKFISLAQAYAQDSCHYKSTTEERPAPATAAVHEYHCGRPQERPLPFEGVESTRAGRWPGVSSPPHVIGFWCVGGKILHKSVTNNSLLLPLGEAHNLEFAVVSSRVLKFPF